MCGRTILPHFFVVKLSKYAFIKYKSANKLHCAVVV